MGVTRHAFVVGRVPIVPPPPTPPPSLINVGALELDGGVATPEQIPLWLPTTGAVAQSATATCRYKRTADSTWTTGHPLYRIAPVYNGAGNQPVWGPVDTEDGFAWTIFDLQQGTSYDVEVTVTEGAAVVVKTLTTTTRSLPAAAGTPNKTANSAATIISQLATLVPGDVLEIANGTYDFTQSLGPGASGTANNPIIIRGQSRGGVIIRRTTLGSSFAIFFLSRQHVIYENFTIQGSGVDQGNGILCQAFQGGTNNEHSFTTIRNITATGIDCFVNTVGRVGNVRDPATYDKGMLVYNNTATGNNQWTTPFIYTSATWNDNGIQIPGRGNCAFNNTMTGFGDSFSFGGDSGGTGAECDGGTTFFYRNEIRNNCDDTFEADYGRRNCAFYDNRIHNSINATSLAPIFKGPIMIFRNIWVNILRARIHKWNNTQSGQFLYNNTLIYGPVNDDNSGPLGDMCGWYQPGNGPQRYYGFRNNIHVYRGASTYDGRLLRLDNGSPGGPLGPEANDPMDWDHNSWYPNRGWRVPHNQTTPDYASLAAAQAGWTNIVPIFSGNVRPFVQDNITVANPFTTTYTPPSPDARTEYTGTFYPVLSNGDVAKNSGAVIPNITDGYTGGSPDRGAIISGRAAVSYGDPASQPDITSALEAAAASITTPNTFLPFKGLKSGTSTPGSLDYRQNHPSTPTNNNSACDPTEDGNTTTSPHTAINWSSCGIYDPITKRVMWMSSGANGQFAGGYIYNTHAIYDEDTDTWSVIRAFRGTATNEGSIGHNYGGNAFHPTNRKLYKKTFG